jgi:N-acetyl-alpha-D-muramate 1-phosphate uridylyltransferase
VKAFILAAGRGERMRPLTDATPKPLLKVRGKALIEWHVESLVAQGLREIIINTAWLGAQIEAALGDGARYGARIAYSREAQALETAGALAFARQLLPASEPFALLSADIFAPEFRFPLADIEAFTRNTKLLAHLYLVPNPPFHPAGDFGVDAQGFAINEGRTRLTFANFSLHRMALVSDVKAGEKAKLVPHWRAAAERQQITASLYSGPWENVGTPEQLDRLDSSQHPLA